MREFPDMTARDLEGLSEIFRYYAEVETPRLDSPVYTDYSFGVSKDRELLELCSQIERSQPAPNILYASVQDLLMQNPAASPEAETLAAFYPAISGRPIPKTSPWKAFRTWFGLSFRPGIGGARSGVMPTHRCSCLSITTVDPGANS